MKLRLHQRRPAPILLASVLSEAGRNLCTGTARALVLALVFASALGALAWVEVATAGNASKEVADFVAAGASTYTLTSTGNVDGAACEGLSETGNVDVAGAVRQTDGVRLEVIRSTPVPVYEVTPRLLGLFDLARANASAAGVYLSPGLAEVVAPQLASLEGDRKAGSQSLPPVNAIGVYRWPDDGRPTSLQYAIIAETPPLGAFDQCWIRATDPATDPSFLLRSVLLRDAGAGIEVELGQLNPTFGTTLSTKLTFATRPTRLAWLAAMVFGALLGAASIWLRRLEVASARDFGWAAGAQQLQSLLEALSWATAGLLLAAPALAFRASQEMTDQRDIALVAAPILLGGLVGALAGVAAASALIRQKPTSEYLRTR